jgi:chromosome segregation ATPase
MEKMTMQANKKIFSFLILSALTFLLTGCPAFQEPLKVVLKPNSTKQQSNVSKRFQDVAPKGQTTVDSAIELSKKNTEFLEQMMVLRQENQKLTAENRRLKDRIAVLEPELKQAKKHLDDADDLLIDMTTELNNWKIQILGFQDEIRNADIAQMEILLKIAKAMGAEIIPEQEETKQSTETLTSGKPNE